MSTTLVVPLLLFSFSWTVVSLLILRVIVEQQTRSQLSSDLGRSVNTYSDLQRLRGEMLLRESSLLSDLPSLKALMTSGDQPTIEDGGTQFWQTSGSDLFALLSSDGALIAAYHKNAPPDRAALGLALRPHLNAAEPFYLALNGHLYEVSVQPLVFGSKLSGNKLGYVAMGYAMDDRIAREIGDASAAEVEFSDGTRWVAGTLPSAIASDLQGSLPALQSTRGSATIRLHGERFLATAVPLTLGNGPAGQEPQLVVLKSFSPGQALLARVNRWVATLTLLAIGLGVLVVLSISRSITRPLAAVVAGARAVGAGDYDQPLLEDGSEEVRELSRAFNRMRVELQQSQRELVQAERLATIGRMASSISHDLRHYLAAMYANAEFMAGPELSPVEREELLSEVRAAVNGMTELLDSLLLFTQTGRTLHREFESIPLLLQRAVAMLRAHPAARGVQISVEGLVSSTAWVDGQKLGRAVFNLLLNACQAALHSPSPAVILSLAIDETFLRIHVADNGPGVPASLERTMFLPFVSEGKQSGTGLGLTLAEQIAAEHGGYVHYARTSENLTLFSIVLPLRELDACKLPASPSLPEREAVL